MKKLKSLWLTLTGSVSSVVPVLFACCKSGACVGVCASPVASLFGISTASIASSPLMSAVEPILIAISAVSFTVSYYTLYVLPKYAVCGTSADCACGPTDKEKRKVKVSKWIFWIGLVVSIAFLSYFEYQKYQSNVASANTQSCSSGANSECCPEPQDAEVLSDSSDCSAPHCCDSNSTY
ncbi:MAG: hypothetical protein V4561_00100 [Bacteroidota bacterium]